eukprot:TRINITY_DN25878_c0_g1_i1.p1 TRINITY_DN25878_c0_g1~~TRINITY_DN25878_c0_g1_i1.p1  ORF type:complete len:422 (-),score=69.51 TRINITY_DN25878_c0_g1_i1:81-1346(-)
MGKYCSRLCRPDRRDNANAGEPLVMEAAAVHATSAELLAAEKCFYMNFKIINIADMLPKLMRAKFRQEGKSDTAINLAGKGCQFLASHPSVGKKYANKVADCLTEAIPVKLEENGIHFRLTKVHCGEMGFVVLRAEVIDIDLLKVMEVTKGTEFAERLSPLVGVARRFRDVDRAALPNIQHQLMLKLEKDIPAFMWEKLRFKMVMICKPSSEQADFFFDALAPQRFEMVFKVLNREEAAPRLAGERASRYFVDTFGRGRHLGMVAGAVASKLVSKAPDEIFGKLVARRLSRIVPEFLADVGVTAIVTERFIAPDQSGRTILRCDVLDVDLPAFRSCTGVVGRGLDDSMAPNQMMQRLGRDGRAIVHEAIRKYIRLQFPVYVSTVKGVQVELLVRDIEPSSDELMDIDMDISESEDDSGRCD